MWSTDGSTSLQGSRCWKRGDKEGMGDATASDRGEDQFSTAQRGYVARTALLSIDLPFFALFAHSQIRHLVPFVGHSLCSPRREAGFF